MVRTCHVLMTIMHYEKIQITILTVTNNNNITNDLCSDSKLWNPCLCFAHGPRPWLQTQDNQRSLASAMKPCNGRARFDSGLQDSDNLRKTWTSPSPLLLSLTRLDVLLRAIPLARQPTVNPRKSFPKAVKIRANCHNLHKPLESTCPYETQ